MPMWKSEALILLYEARLCARHLPGFHASVVPCAMPCFWVMFESPFTVPYFCFMGGMMGELTGRWEKFREVSMVGI